MCPGCIIYPAPFQLHYLASTAVDSPPTWKKSLRKTVRSPYCSLQKYIACLLNIRHLSGSTCHFSHDNAGLSFADAQASKYTIYMAICSKPPQPFLEGQKLSIFCRSGSQPEVGCVLAGGPPAHRSGGGTRMNGWKR